MRRIAVTVTVTVAAALLAGCAAQVAETPKAETAAPTKPKEISSDLMGASAGELIQAFGQPALQVREGPGLKLQFRGQACILDAYLYSPQSGTGAERVTYVDARTSSGLATDRDQCALSLSRR